jgi:hypothetical protein
MASAIVTSISIRSCSSFPVKGQPAGPAETQSCVSVARSRVKSPLFQAERRTLARCSEAGADFVFIIMRVNCGTYRTDGRPV